MKTAQEDIEKIYSEHSRRLYLASLRILGNSQEAEDVMQDTILKVCTKLSRSKIDNIGAYLTRSCINKSLDLIRKRKTLDSYKAEIAAQGNASEEKYDGIQSEESSVLLQKVVRLIAKLPHNCRQVVSLKLIEGYDYEEIAQITQMKDNSIRSCYMRGRQHLAILMKKEGITL